jgi:hypothetical protein
VRASFDLDGAGFEGFVAEVAARIIQTYWRKAQEHKVHRGAHASPRALAPRVSPTQPYCSPDRLAAAPCCTTDSKHEAYADLSRAQGVCVYKPCHSADHGQQAAEIAGHRDASSRSSLDDMEALMNRYRNDSCLPGPPQRSDKDAVEHAVKLLRAAGMHAQVDAIGVLTPGLAVESIVPSIPTRMHRRVMCIVVVL